MYFPSVVGWASCRPTGIRLCFNPGRSHGSFKTRLLFTAAVLCCVTALQFSHSYARLGLPDLKVLLPHHPSHNRSLAWGRFWRWKVEVTEGRRCGGEVLGPGADQAQRGRVGHGRAGLGRAWAVGTPPSLSQDRFQARQRVEGWVGDAELLDSPLRLRARFEPFPFADAPWCHEPQHPSARKFWAGLEWSKPGDTNAHLHTVKWAFSPAGSVL